MYEIRLLITSYSYADVYKFDVSFFLVDDGSYWRGTGTCPTIEECFDEALNYMEKTKRDHNDQKQGKTEIRPE
jgi:hypothetical protein